MNALRGAAFALCTVLAGPVSADDGPHPPRHESTSDETKEKGTAETQEDPLRIYDELEVRERGDDLVGIAASAAEGSTGREDLARRPLQRPGELVETAPGVVATQHSGGGKANQYFLRGFNLDHGTDFRVAVGGVPVNMPTHGHGQGYADLSFLIPELVDRVRYRKGPYYADSGDFSAAGGVDMELVRELDQAMISTTGGSYDYGRVLWADSWPVADGTLLAAADFFHEDGPWTRGDDFDGYRTVVRYSRGSQAHGWSLTALGYDADWLSTDQVPRRAVEDGSIGRFDLLDPGPRGGTERFSLAAEHHFSTGASWSRVRGYLLSYDFHLVSNFTYFLDDAVNGDQFEQVDDRLVAGFEFDRRWLSSWAGRRVETAVGVQLRGDDIDNGLFRTRDLDRTGAVRQDEVQLLTGGPWAESLIQWNDKVRARLGLRADGYLADVESDLGANSGDAEDWLLSPKLSVILGPWKSTELYFNLGYGFHSNDARGATIRVDPVEGGPATAVEPLVRARGADVGVRTTLLPGLQSTVTVFGLKLDSELVFVGDGGATEASRPSRRFGVEWTNTYQARPWLFLDLDVTLADAEFIDADPAGDAIPGAVEETIAAGIAIDGLGPVFGSLRWRYFGSAPLIEDGSARSSSTSLINGRLGYRVPNGLSLALEIFNLLDREDSDIEYFYASRLPGEPVGGVEDIHFHPVEKRSFRLAATWRY